MILNHFYLFTRKMEETRFSIKLITILFLMLKWNVGATKKICSNPKFNQWKNSTMNKNKEEEEEIKEYKIKSRHENDIDS